MMKFGLPRGLAIAVLAMAASTFAAAGPSFRGHPITEELEPVGNFRNGTFVFPNEIHADVWKPVLEGRRDVYIGVGTFRVLNTAVYNDFDHIFMLDVDPGVAHFNRIMLDLIRECETREEFLSYLTGLNIVRGGKPPFADLPSRYWDNLPGSLGEEYEKIFIDDNYRAKFRSERELKALREGKWLKGGPLFKGSGTNKNTITVSDKLYAVARRQVLANRFTVVQGSITGLESLRDIAIALRKQKMKVSAFDISNVTDYIQNFHMLSANMNLLPFADDARVLHTYGGNYRESDEWTYHASRVERFRNQLESAMRTPDDPFLSDRPKDLLYKNLRENSEALPNGLTLTLGDPCLARLRRMLDKK